MRTALVFALALLTAACGTETPPEGAATRVEDADGPLVVYAGRKLTLVQPILDQFTAETGIEVEVRDGETAELALALSEEGNSSPADVFWAQDAGALGLVAGSGLLATLPDSLTDLVDARFRGDSSRWVALSGRARVLAYSPSRADTSALPRSVFDLADGRFQGRVAWAPTNASFQSFVTAMRQTVGDDSTRAWLQAMKDNGTSAYSNNVGILDAIAAGEADYGLPNHYYLLQRLAEQPDFPVAQTSFAAGDVGNLVNVAGAGILMSSRRPNAAAKLLAYLLSERGQTYFRDETAEYPVAGPDALGDLGGAPGLGLDRLADLDGTLRLLRDVGLL